MGGLGLNNHDFDYINLNGGRVHDWEIDTNLVRREVAMFDSVEKLMDALDNTPLTKAEYTNMLMAISLVGGMMIKPKAIYSEDA